MTAASLSGRADTAVGADPLTALAGLTWAKGHGTQNDFVIVPDVDARLDLTPADVAALCDRRAGIGGDGLLRVVRSDSAWFMDYRNADGSLAEMCGNGIRVFAAYLLHAGLVGPAADEELEIATRAGVKRVRRCDSDGRPEFAVDLGPWRFDGEYQVDLRRASADGPVVVAGLAGLGVDVGNPHTVVELDPSVPLAEVELTHPITVTPVPANGINVEVVVPDEPDGALGRLGMRVRERGVGETRSCGTGAVAAALATRRRLAHRTGRVLDTWSVRVPGGRLLVSVPPGTAGDAPGGAHVELRGPAVVLAEGRLLG